MRLEDTQLNVPATASRGTVFPCGHLVNKWVYVDGIAGGAVLSIEGRAYSGGPWIVLGEGALNADGRIEVPESLIEISVNRTTLGTGSPKAVLVGHNARTE